MSVTNETLAARYQREGYLIAEHLLPGNLINSLRQRITDVGAQRVPGFPAKDVEFEPNKDGTAGLITPRKINRCAENDEVFMAAASDKAILDIVESLIGGDIKLFGSQCFMKPPGGVEKPYHQDSAYFTIEPLSLVTCWIALDEVTVENGGCGSFPAVTRGNYSITVSRGKWADAWTCRCLTKKSIAVWSFRSHCQRAAARSITACCCTDRGRTKQIHIGEDSRFTICRRGQSGRMRQLPNRRMLFCEVESIRIVYKGNSARLLQ